MTLSPLLFLKLTLTPVLVAGISLAAKRFGPTFAGLTMGLPWMTGPILLFLAIEKGIPFAAATSVGVLTAVVGVAGYLVAYAWTARVAGWGASLLAAATAFWSIGYGLTFVEIGPAVASLAGTTALLAAFAVMPRLDEVIGARALPWWDIPVRMFATALMVAAISFVADQIGPRLSGVVASFPVIATVIGCFTHARWGAGAVVRVLRAVSLSLLSFVAFFTVTAFGLPTLGITLAFSLATIAGIVTSGVLLWLAQRR